jgi:hypothetical protein
MIGSILSYVKSFRKMLLMSDPSLREPQPEEVLSGDYVQIVNEEELLKWFIGRWYTIGKIKEGKEGERIYQLLNFNLKPVQLDLETGNLEYWAKREFFQVERRKLKGEEIYFKRTVKGKALDNGKEELSLLDRVFMLIRNVITSGTINEKPESMEIILIIIFLLVLAIAVFLS